VWKVLVAILLVGVGIAATIYGLGGFNPKSAAATDYLTATASVADVNQDVAATGSIVPATRTAAAFGASPWDADDADAAPAGQSTFDVESVEVSVGDAVRAGDILARAETADLERQLGDARNNLEASRLNLVSANDQLDDANTAALRRAAKIGRLNAINARNAAQAAVTDLEAQIAAATLRAPVDGVVSEVNLLADRPSPAGAAFVIESTVFEITTDVVEDDIDAVAVGQTAAVSIGAIEAELTGRVTAVSRSASADGGSGVVSYPVTVTLEGAPDAARSGMSADVTITIESAKNVLSVPASALHGRAGSYTVDVLAPGRAPTPVAVNVGLLTDSVAEIKSGLSAGDVVVIGTANELKGSTNNGLGGGITVPGGGGFKPGDGPKVQVGP
jgi:RND family efflux transporter MFP subunit